MGEVPVAMVVKAKGRGISEDELKQFFIAQCARLCSAYAHPRHFDFVTQLPAPARSIARLSSASWPSDSRPGLTDRACPAIAMLLEQQISAPGAALP